MVVVLPDDHPLAARTPPGRPLHLEQLRDEAWVAIVAGHVVREQFDRAAAEAGFTPEVRFETESYDVTQALVGAGSGVALVSRLALTHTRGTVHRELVHPRLHREIRAVTQGDTTLTPLVDVFLKLLRDVARERVATWRESPAHD